MKYLSRILFPLYLIFLFTVFLPEQRNAIADESTGDESGIKLDIKFASSIEDRMPVGIDSVFSVEVGKVYCWSVVSGVQDTMQIFHVWNHEGQEKSRVPIQVAGSYFRAFTFQTIDRSMIGNWTVYIVDESNTVLGLAKFRISA